MKLPDVTQILATLPRYTWSTVYHPERDTFFLLDTLKKDHHQIAALARPSPHGKSLVVLELGSGCGLVSKFIKELFAVDDIQLVSLCTDITTAAADATHALAPFSEVLVTPYAQPLASRLGAVFGGADFIVFNAPAEPSDAEELDSTNPLMRATCGGYKGAAVILQSLSDIAACIRMPPPSHDATCDRGCSVGTSTAILAVEKDWQSVPCSCGVAFVVGRTVNNWDEIFREAAQLGLSGTIHAVFGETVIGMLWPSVEGAVPTTTLSSGRTSVTSSQPVSHGDAVSPSFGGRPFAACFAPAPVAMTTAVVNAPEVQKITSWEDLAAVSGSDSASSEARTPSCSFLSQIQTSNEFAYGRLSPTASPTSNHPGATETSFSLATRSAPTSIANTPSIYQFQAFEGQTQTSNTEVSYSGSRWQLSYQSEQLARQESGNGYTQSQITLAREVMEYVYGSFLPPKELQVRCNLALLTPEDVDRIGQMSGKGESPADPTAQYGSLVSIGATDRRLGGPNISERSVRFSTLNLVKQENPTGLLQSRGATISARPDGALPTASDTCASIAFALSRDHAQMWLTEFVQSTLTDMFQIGRDPHKNDFHVTGPSVMSSTNNRSNCRSSTMTSIGTSVGTNIGASENEETIFLFSRYALRFLVTRATGEIRVFAAGFDAKRRIFLGERAIHIGAADGLVTNSVMVWKPSVGKWREVTLMGKLRDPRTSARKAGKACETGDDNEPLDDNNILTAGSLVSSAGVLFEWIPKDAAQANMEVAWQNVYALRRRTVTCAVTRQTLRPPVLDSPHPVIRERVRRRVAQMRNPLPTMMIHIPCGHPYARGSGDDSCGFCGATCDAGVALVVSPCPTFARAPSTHMFVPCGHAAPAETALLWASRPVPMVTGTAEDRSATATECVCPVCMTRLEHPKIVQLSFPPPTQRTVSNGKRPASASSTSERNSISSTVMTSSSNRLDESASDEADFGSPLRSSEPTADFVSPLRSSEPTVFCSQLMWCGALLLTYLCRFLSVSCRYALNWSASLTYLCRFLSVSCRYALNWSASLSRYSSVRLPDICLRERPVAAAPLLVERGSARDDTVVTYMDCLVYLS